MPISTNLPTGKLLPSDGNLMTVDDLVELYEMVADKLPIPAFNILKALLIQLAREGDLPTLALVNSLNSLAVIRSARDLRERLTIYNKPGDVHWLDEHIENCRKYIEETFSRYGCPLAPCNPLHGETAPAR